MSNDVKLEPCPFCGGEALLENTITQASIMCCDCPCIMRRDHTTRTFDDGTHRVIAAWNTRTAAQPEREAVPTNQLVSDLEKLRWHAESNFAENHVRIIDAAITALSTPAPAVSTDEIVAMLEEGNRRGLYDTTKIGPELVAFLDDRRGMLASLRDEMSEGYRGWLDDAVDALRIASERLAALTTPAPAVSRDETNLADELERLLNKRADRSVPGGRAHDELTHFVEKHRVAILSRLRGEGE
jgi:hypothetical protein